MGKASNCRRPWIYGGEAPSRWPVLLFLEKLAFLTPFGSHFARFWSHVKKMNCLKLKLFARIKLPSPLSTPSPPYLHVKFKTRSTACDLGFFKCLGYGRGDGPLLPLPLGWKRFI